MVPIFCLTCLNIFVTIHKWIKCSYYCFWFLSFVILLPNRLCVWWCHGFTFLGLFTKYWLIPILKSVDIYQNRYDKIFSTITVPHIALVWYCGSNEKASFRLNTLFCSLHVYWHSHGASLLTLVYTLDSLNIFSNNYT